MALTTIERRRVEAAVETLARYNKSPFISDFLKQQPKPRISSAKEKDEICVLIKQVLLGEYRGKKKFVLKLDELIAHLDRLQETGRQHLYLFRLPEKERDKLLASLQDLNEVKALLGGEEELYNGGHLVWEASNGPQLALVRHDAPRGTARPRSLILKWVETRVYWAPQEPAGVFESGEPSEEQGESQEAEDLEEEEEHQRVRIRVRREERATTFFIIDLDNGDCELRIQAVHGQARIARQKQLATYRALVADLFGFEAVGPTVLAPAIRRALVAREVPIVRCSAILPDGGRFIGGKNELPPVDVRKLQAGVAIRFDWPQPSGGIGRVELDGRLDEILILRPLLPEQHRLVLERVRRWRREGLAGFTSHKEPRLIEGEVDLQQPLEETAGSGLETPAMTKEAWFAILKAALGSGIRLEPPAAEPGIDRAIREYARTHTVEEPSGGEAERPGVVPPPTAATADWRALEQFLGYIREVAQSERLTYQREIKLVRSEEHLSSRIFVLAALLALSIVASGAFLLLFVPGKLAIGTITGLLGVLTGRGTVLLHSYAKNLKTKRELIQSQQRDSHQTLLAIQAVLSIPNPQERSRAMISAASSLLSRVAVPLSERMGE